MIPLVILASCASLSVQGQQYRVYLVKNAGIATCLNATTGEAIYQQRIGSRGPCYSSPVGGDGKIYVRTEKRLFAFGLAN
jgi:outer membrane protein assembly factor BamB